MKGLTPHSTHSMKLSLNLAGFAFLLVYSACIPHSEAAEPGDRAQAEELSRTSEMSVEAVQEPVPELSPTTTRGEATEPVAENGDPPAEEEGFPRHNLNLLLRYTFEDTVNGLTTGFE